MHRNVLRPRADEYRQIMACAVPEEAPLHGDVMGLLANREGLIFRVSDRDPVEHDVIGATGNHEPCPTARAAMVAPAAAPEPNPPDDHVARVMHHQAAMA